MIRQDAVSQVMSLTAVMIVVYLSTFQQGVTILFPAVLLISGITLQFYLQRRYETDFSIDGEEAKNIMYYALIGLAFIAIGGVLAPKLWQPVQRMQLTGMDQLLYSMLIAVSEEQFFRGALFNWLLESLPAAALAIVGSALIFVVYHFAIYQTNFSNLTYVFVGGVALAWIDYRTQRLSPSVLAHVLNNFLAVVV